MKSQSTKNPVRIIPCGALFESYGQTLDPSKYCPELPEAQCMLAEGVGFEPTIRNYRIPDFESGAFDHSAILPLDGGILSELFKVGMLTNFLRPICVTPTNPIAAKKFFLRNLLDFSTKN